MAVPAILFVILRENLTLVSFYGIIYNLFRLTIDRVVNGTYSILKIPWESTVNDAIDLRNSLLDILIREVPSRYPHLMRIEGFYPEIEGQFNLCIWTFTVKK